MPARNTYDYLVPEREILVIRIAKVMWTMEVMREERRGTVSCGVDRCIRKDLD